MRSRFNLMLFPIAAALLALGETQTGMLATVVSKPVSRNIELPGEFLPFLSVALHARVPGYVERVRVDRGSVVRRGQLLVEMSAPEMAARTAEAQFKVQAAQAELAQAQAQLAAIQSTDQRLRKAADTPGAVAGNELIQVQKQVDAADASVRSHEEAKRAAEAVVQSQKEMESYLRLTAPFDGVVTERLVHPGALVGPDASQVLLVIDQISRLRLVVPVPEEVVGGTVRGTIVAFHVPAYPERAYSGKIARVSHALDQKTRSMAVELDVFNRDGSLAPGMYPRVSWLVRSPGAALMVPKTSVVTTTERTFVIRNSNGRAEWVDVKKGAADGDSVQISGNVQAGDKVVRRATDELRDGSPITAGTK